MDWVSPTDPCKNLNFEPRQKVMKTLYQRKFLIRFEGNLKNLYPFKSVDGERHKTNLLKLFVKKTGQVSAAPKPQFPSLTKPNYITFITSIAMHCIFEIHFAINRLLKSVKNLWFRGLYIPLRYAQKVMRYKLKLYHSLWFIGDLYIFAWLTGYSRFPNFIHRNIKD